jgi:tRNA G18 (ribose-2'-O)-methylase SpoU
VFSGEPYVTPAAPGADEAPAVRLSALLDNIRSLRNVGSIFRTADGAGVEHLYLGGITPTPDHPKLAKTALGAELEVPWTHGPDAAALAAALVAQGHRLWALEGGDSDSVFEARPARGDDDRPIVLVLGHEVSGVDPRILRLCQRVVHIPMLGIKDSLNVSVAFGVAVYSLRFAGNSD